jgi:hypothetical protein
MAGRRIKCRYGNNKRKEKRAVIIYFLEEA